MANPRGMIERYLAGELSAAEQAELAQWLGADEANRQAFLAEVDFVRTVRGVLINEQRELATQAEFDVTQTLPTSQMDADALTKDKYVGALSYVLRHTFTPKRVATLAAAAAVLLGVVLTIVLTGGPEQQEQITEAPQPSDEPGERIPFEPATTTTVATLTAEHDAVWDRRPGQDLYAGQRFELITGFAEITTQRGAVAILEGPARVELTYSDNAIRLHAGKLVGICETESSKGFVVHTPHMDVVDLSTRFGVLVDRAEKTVAEVFEGSVRVSPAPNVRGGFEARSMEQGDTLALDQAGVQMQPASDDATPFAGLVALAAERDMLGIAGLSGQVEWVAKESVLQDGRQVDRTGKAWVCLEHSGLEMSGQLALTAQQPGKYDKLDPARFGTVLQGTRVRSYVIGVQPNTTDNAQARGVNAAQGQVVFQGKVLGVIANETHWNEFARSLGDGSAGELFPTHYGMIEMRTSNGTGRDWFAIHPNGSAVDFFLEASASSDLIRVLVLEDE